MLILGIETSCDETSIAVLSYSGSAPEAQPRQVNRECKILSNIVSSSLFRHQEFGGVVPEIASRHCLEQIDFVFQQALHEAHVSAHEIDLIAVTEGPGLIGSLFVGLGFAKALAYQLQIPIVGVNHLEAHLSANFIGLSGSQSQAIPESYVGLLVSGGHTALVFSQNGNFELLGQTVDDAVGEAYDKVAKMMGFDYPGGPQIDRLAKMGNPCAMIFKRPKQDGVFDFSFSGIKTAVLYAMKDMKTGEPKKEAPTPEDLSASFQHSVISWILEKAAKACEMKQAKRLVVGGGVAANSHLRAELERFGREKGVQVWIPPLNLTSDNAAMIARRGLEIFEKNRISDLRLTAQPNLRIA